MTIEDALYLQLTTYSGLAALVNGRVYGLTITENTVLPAVTYQRISTVPIHHRGGYGLERIRFQIDGWDTTFGKAIKLRKEIRAALFAWQRDAEPRVDSTLLQDDRDLREPGTNRFRASMDFMLLAEES